MSFWEYSQLQISNYELPMQIIDGKKIREKILEEIKKEVKKLSFVPVFCDILIGDDPMSLKYVEMKEKIAESVGFAFHKAEFPASISTEELIQEIEKINKIKNMCGVIVQLPLPPHIDRKKVLDSVDPKLDVDCLGSVTSKKFYENYDEENDLCFPTALASMAVLKDTGINLFGKNIVVLGQGMLVGKPVSALLRFGGLSSVPVDSQTEDKEKIIKNADIIISGMGKGKYLTKDMVKEGVVIIDAGTSESEGGVVGDVDYDSMKDIDGYLSPVPGGVGPVTVAMLLQNVLRVAKNKK